MKKFFCNHQKLHIWLLANVAWLGIYLLVRQNRGWMNAVSAHVTGPLRRGLGTLCYRTDASVYEWLCILAVLGAAGYLLWSAAAVVRAKDSRGKRLYTAVLGGVCAGLTACSAFCFFWGMDCYADSFQDKSGLAARPVSVEELYAVTAYFVEKLNETAPRVPRDREGLPAVSRAEILQGAVGAYGGLTARWPFLEFNDRPPKAVRLSRVMSRLDFTGIYCPFTGESNVNVDSPACLLPATVAHELAHQRGFSSEQECNFLAVLACVTSGDPAYAYAGYLLGYIHLGNALYSADQARWQTVYDALPEAARADMRYNNAYWAQFAGGGLKKVSNKLYDGFLKSYGQPQGLKSYGTVVDLLVAYYSGEA